MIIWLNGGFASGKTTLAEELRGRIDGAVVFDPEELGLLLWRWLPRTDDFQDLASWRELVVSTALSLHRHHTGTLIVPMSLVRASYRDEILGGLRAAGADLLHVWLDADLDVLKARLVARERGSGDPRAREWAVRRLEAATAAARRQPSGTLVLRSDQRSPAQLADAVLSASRSAIPSWSMPRVGPLRPVTPGRLSDGDRHDREESEQRDEQHQRPDEGPGNRPMSRSLGVALHHPRVATHAPAAGRGEGPS